MPPKIGQARFERAITRPEQAPPARPAVAFAGRSNVGKSSLINALTGCHGLARTSSTPGRTQEIVYFSIGERWHFVDLPGYGYAKVPLEIKRRWGPMIERYLRKAAALRLVVLILDVRRRPGEHDLRLIDWLADRGLPAVFAVTKTDKLSKSQLARRLRELQGELGLADDSALAPVSACTGAGLTELYGVIRDVLDGA